jgi:hypothetical protein
MAQGTPNFATTPVCGVGLISTGDSSRTSPTNKATVLTAGSSGTRIERIAFCAIGATTASVIRLFVYNGTSYFLWQEIVLPAITPVDGVTPVFCNSANVGAGLEAVDNPNVMPMLLPSGYSLVASVQDTQISGGVNVFAIGGNF